MKPRLARLKLVLALLAPLVLSCAPIGMAQAAERAATAGESTNTTVTSPDRTSPDRTSLDRTPLDRTAIQAWVTAYGDALRQRRDGRLAELIAEDARFSQTFLDEGVPPLLITLTRAEYLQQLRALWRFATRTRYDLSQVRIGAAGDAVTVDLKQEETWELFGKQTGLHGTWQFRLEQRGDSLQATAVRLTTQPW